MGLGVEKRYRNAEAVVASLTPSYPVYCLRPEVLANNARRFLRLFPGRVLYAVKCNPHPMVLNGLHAAGIVDFDTASLPEIAQVAESFPDATPYYMHPVKNRASIRMAHLAYRVRHFVVDHRAELNKVLDEVATRDICIVVRLRTDPAPETVYDLSTKFGCEVAEAVKLLQAVEAAGCQSGLAFHVGSQCGSPEAYLQGLERVSAVIRASGITPSLIDVGGGFPTAYPNTPVPPLEAYMAAIAHGIAALDLSPTIEWMCEPGRALVADAVSLIVQVLLRKGDRLYLNDGVYGSLAEMFLSKLRMPVRLVRRTARVAIANQGFQLFGPTCDSLDVIPGTFELPGDVDEGDWLEIAQLGAYSNAMASRFNGFYPETMVELTE
jgi:ornithine decarboxylase